MKHLILLALVVASTASIVTRADLSGQWTLRMDPDFTSNQGPPVDCTFMQQGADLTVKCGTGSEMKGKVHG